MDRPLSDLQKWIIREAAKVDRLYYSQILTGFFGWERMARHFSPDLIGRAQHRRTVAQLSRSCRRLQALGLVEVGRGKLSGRTAIFITDMGAEWVSADAASAKVEEAKPR
jgi:hypothetical protein